MNIYGWNQIQIFLKGQNDNDSKQDKILIGFFKNFENGDGEKFIGHNTKVELGDRINSINLFENFIGKIAKVSLIKKSIKNKITEQEIKRIISYNEFTELYASFNPNISQNFTIFDKIHNLSSSIVNNEQNKICYNYIYDYSEYDNLLFNLGNINNLLPLYEIFYKHFNHSNNELDEDDFEKEENKKKINIFKNLIHLTNIFLSDERIFNYSLHNNFFLYLSTFYEKFDDIIFHVDNELSFYFITLLKINVLIVEENKKKKDLVRYYQYIKSILLNIKIIMKLTPQQKFKLKSIFDNYIRPIMKDMFPLIPSFTLYLFTKKNKIDDGLFLFIDSLINDKGTKISEKIEYFFRLLSIDDNDNNKEFQKKILKLFSNHFSINSFKKTNNYNSHKSLNKIYINRNEILEFFIRENQMKYLIKYLNTNDIEMKIIIIEFLRNISYCFRDVYEKFMKK